MNSSYLRLLPLVLFLIFAFAISTGVLTPKSVKEKTSPIIGMPLPSFTLPLLNRQPELFLASQWKGQVAVINMFASWCEPCKVEHPVLRSLAAIPGVNLYGVAWKDSEENITKYLKESGNPFLSVGVDKTGQTTLLFGVQGLPETYVIDKKGIVRWKYPGPLTQDVVGNTLLPLLKDLNAEK